MSDYDRWKTTEPVEYEPEPAACWRQGCYLAVDDEGCCEVHGYCDENEENEHD